MKRKLADIVLIVVMIIVVGGVVMMALPVIAPVFFAGV